MKKVVLLVVSLMVISVALMGCGKGNDSNNTPKVEVQKAPAEAIGTWYSTRPDTLTIEDDGVYTSEWLTMKTKGTYTVKDGVLSLKGMDGTLYAFKIVKDGNQNTLYFKDSKSSLEYTYYDTKEKADKLIADKKAAEQKTAAEANNTKFKEVQDNLVGTWEWSNVGGTVTFNNDGTYTGTIKGLESGTYQIVDAEHLKMTKGKSTEIYNQAIKLSTTNGYELQFSPLGKLVKK
ncbi:MAG: hypothetical protein GX660_18260 [Clostridiaceae bacterium]|nr:hypothetical protein [Clostridiaceae bacterium]